ncbi:MAG: nucleoside triphosphate pyrophosphohydrolase [Candidatus Adiutrix sp.]
MDQQDKLALAIKQLDEVIKALLHPETGCPWDIQQTPSSITGNVLEEAYELIEALRLESPSDIREEAGDLFFQVAFIGRLAEKLWGYGLAEIIEQVTAKMVSRHPHVFAGGAALKDAQAVLDQWQAIKRKDIKHKRLLASVPQALPALQRAHRLGDRAAKCGFDWDSFAGVKAKVNEELNEWEELLPGFDKKTASPNRRAQIKHEFGDVLLSLASMARHLGFSAEEALSCANARFVKRFNYIEDILEQEGLKPEDVPPSRLEELWQKAKTSE